MFTNIAAFASPLQAHLDRVAEIACLHPHAAEVALPTGCGNVLTDEDIRGVGRP